MRVLRTLRQILIALLVTGGVFFTFWQIAAPGGGVFADLLDLNAPIGPTTAVQLAALVEDPTKCQTLLQAAQVEYEALPPVTGGQCPRSGTVRFEPGGIRSIAWQPASPAVSCQVAAALLLWEREVVQVAAIRHFGRRVTAIDHFGSYSCRRLYGRADGEWSEHATANAIDVAGFRLEDGTRITLSRDWDGPDANRAFLREIRNGACRLFATTLSPAYNAAHADHFHFDQARRGRLGWSMCN